MPLNEGDQWQRFQDMMARDEKLRQIKAMSMPGVAPRPATPAPQPRTFEAPSKPLLEAMSGIASGPQEVSVNPLFDPMASMGSMDSGDPTPAPAHASPKYTLNTIHGNVRGSYQWEGGGSPGDLSQGHWTYSRDPVARRPEMFGPSKDFESLVRNKVADQLTNGYTSNRDMTYLLTSAMENMARENAARIDAENQPAARGRTPDPVKMAEFAQTYGGVPLAKAEGRVPTADDVNQIDVLKTIGKDNLAIFGSPDEYVTSKLGVLDSTPLADDDPVRQYLLNQVELGHKNEIDALLSGANPYTMPYLWPGSFQRDADLVRKYFGRGVDQYRQKLRGESK